jgi:hypothetical protein
MCTQCCQASVCLYHVYQMLTGPCLFLSCVPNIFRPVSLFILCTQCCQASVCLYHVYPMLPGQCLFLSCVPNVASPVSVFGTLGTQDTNRHRPDNIGYTRYNQTGSWQHWIHKIKTDTGLATLATQDKNRYWSGNIGYSRIVSCVPNVVRPVSVCILCTQCSRPVSVCIMFSQCCHASICLYRAYPMLSGQCLFVSCVQNVSGQCLFLSCVPNVARPVSVCIMCT